MPSRTRELLRKVAARQRLVSLGAWLYRFTLALAVIYFAAVIVERLFGVIPDWYNAMTVLTVPAAALLLAMFFHRGVDDSTAARLVDVSMDTKDLFLTTATIAGSPGEYQPLVVRAAEDQAPAVPAARVVPFNWSPNATRALAVLAVLTAATFIPQQDLLGKQAEQNAVADRKEQLEKQAELAKKKAAEITAKKDLTKERSDEVDLAIEKLKMALNRMKPDQPKANLKQLNEEQKDVGQKWRDKKEEQLNKTSKSDLAQRFGAMADPKQQQWQKEMQQGKTDALRQEMKSLQSKMEKLAESKDSVEKQQLQSEIQQQMQQMAEFAQNQPGGEQLAQSIQQALQQLQAGQNDNLSQQAQQALQQQMQLSQAQLQQMAQQVRDIKTLEQMLQTLQMAKQCNSQGGLDGQKAGQCQGLGDYMKLYQEMMAQAGQNQGEGNGQGGDSPNAGNKGGMGGRGTGRGGKAPEDDSLQSDFQSEKSQTAMQAGKILLQWKTKELGVTGKANVNYDEQITVVKDAVPDAILQEQVPPGYHEAIQKFFDAYKADQAGAAPAEAADAPTE